MMSDSVSRFLQRRCLTASDGIPEQRSCGIRRQDIGLLQFGLIAILSLVCAPDALAQSRDRVDVDTAGLAVEAVLGWDGTVDQSIPIPVSLLLTNSTDQIIEGQLRLSDPMNRYRVTLGEVVLGPRSTRRFTAIQDLSEWFECFATLSDGEQVLWRRELALVTGKEFLTNVNYALFIDGSGRKLAFFNEVSNTTAMAMATSEFDVAGEAGRPVGCLSVKPWQVPKHPGPLIVAQAVVFPEGFDDGQLNRVQWRSVAEWMCQGGVVFVHGASREVIDQLVKAAPLDADAPAQWDGFQFRRVGLGAIYEYPDALLSSTGDEGRARIAQTTANLTKHHIGSLVESGSLHRQRGGRADLNRIWIFAFFGMYTFLSGLVALLLFRLSQRRIGTYTVIVVVTASVFSALLGWMLRFSQGDLRWLTVTQAGAGGVVQVGRIEAQSAGGRNSQVAIRGEHPDLQLTGRTRSYYSRNRWRTGYPHFSWQPNLASDKDNAYQINVPLTPWGQRRLQATAYRRDVRPMDFELEFEPRDDAAEQSATLQMPTGMFTLKLVNHLPFDISDCRVVVGVTHKASVQANPNQAAPMGISPQQFAMDQAMKFALGQGNTSTAPNGLIDVYHMQPLPHLSAGSNYHESFEARFYVPQGHWDRDRIRSWPSGSVAVPRISRLGTASAWILARLENSPAMTIDEQHSDFVPQEQLHLFVQEIHPESMPDAAVFLDTRADTDAEPDPNAQ